MLQQEGYSICEDLTKDGVIKIIKKDALKDIASLKDKVIELDSSFKGIGRSILVGLEESLIREKSGVLYKSILEAVEKPLIEHILERAEGNQLKAARILGINRNTMRAKIRKLGINPGIYK